MFTCIFTNTCIFKVHKCQNILAHVAENFVVIELHSKSTNKQLLFIQRFHTSRREVLVQVMVSKVLYLLCSS